MANPLRVLVGRAVREVQCHVDMVRPSGAPSIAFLQNSEVGDSLRSYAVAQEIRKLGLRTISIPGNLTLRQRKRLLDRFQPDIVFVEMARHRLNRRELLAGWPYVLDVDDADFLDPRLEKPMRELAEGAVGVIAGSRFVADWASTWQPNVVVVWTGTPRHAQVSDPPSTRRPIVTWAQSDPLAYPNELSFVAGVVSKVIEKRGGVEFRLYGWKPNYDRSSIAPLDIEGAELDFRAPMPYREFVKSLCDVSVGLAPLVSESQFSRGKSFGKILAYLDARVPVVCSDEADHGLAFANGGAVVSNDQDVWVDAICRLLDEPEERDRMSSLGTAVLEEQLTIERSSRKVADFLTQTIARHSRKNEREGQTQWSN